VYWALRRIGVGLTDAGSAGQALEALIGLRAGEGNSRLLAWRAAMLEAGLAPATINRRLSAVRSALRFARTIGATTWVPEISGLEAQTYRDTRGPGVAGTRALLGAAAEKSPAKAARDTAIIRLMFDSGPRSVLLSLPLQPEALVDRRLVLGDVRWVVVLLHSLHQPRTCVLPCATNRHEPPDRGGSISAPPAAEFLPCAPGMAAP
jgi:hypothetical protein